MKAGSARLKRGRGRGTSSRAAARAAEPSRRWRSLTAAEAGRLAPSHAAAAGLAGRAACARRDGWACTQRCAVRRWLATRSAAAHAATRPHSSQPTPGAACAAAACGCVGPPRPAAPAGSPQALFQLRARKEKEKRWEPRELDRASCPASTSWPPISRHAASTRALRGGHRGGGGGGGGQGGPRAVGARLAGRSLPDPLQQPATAERWQLVRQCAASSICCQLQAAPACPLPQEPGSARLSGGPRRAAAHAAAGARQGARAKQGGARQKPSSAHLSGGPPRASMT